jgi:hypothetical protein
MEFSVRLDPDQLEQLADLVAERLQSQVPATPATEVVGVAELAKRLGCSPDYVRDHREELGGVKPGGRTLYPWPPPVLQNARDGSERSSTTPDPVPSGVSRPRRIHPRGQVPSQVPELLPVRGAR